MESEARLYDLVLTRFLHANRFPLRRGKMRPDSDLRSMVRFNLNGPCSERRAFRSDRRSRRLAGRRDSLYVRNMYPYSRINAWSGPRRRNLLSPVLPWIFIVGVAAGAMLPIRSWIDAPRAVNPRTPTEARAIWARAADAAGRHQADVIRTIDGDTFEALVHLWPGLDMTTRVRLRGIDTAEMKASCAEEFRLAKAARSFRI